MPWSIGRGLPLLRLMAGEQYDRRRLERHPIKFPFFATDHSNIGRRNIFKSLAVGIAKVLAGFAGNMDCLKPR